MAVLERFREAVVRRRQGEPLAYVIGEMGFRMVDLKVDRRVLIPRPETEGLVERVLSWAASRRGPEDRWGRAADIGTGCGCIALSLAIEGRFDAVVATDVSHEALDVARENVARVGPPVAVELRPGNLLEPLGGEMFDVVVSNPTYVTEEELAGLDPGVRDFEPCTALVSGPDGMAHTRLLLEGAGARLVPGGLLALEVDSMRAEAVLRLAVATGWQEVRLEHDLFSSPRYLLATRRTGR
jgi:release factor glutamine methyltransferase